MAFASVLIFVTLRVTSGGVSKDIFLRCENMQRCDPCEVKGGEEGRGIKLKAWDKGVLGLSAYLRYTESENM